MKLLSDRMKPIRMKTVRIDIFILTPSLLRLISCGLVINSLILGTKTVNKQKKIISRPATTSQTFRFSGEKACPVFVWNTNERPLNGKSMGLHLRIYLWSPIGEGDFLGTRLEVKSGVFLSRTGAKSK